MKLTVVAFVLKPLLEKNERGKAGLFSWAVETTWGKEYPVMKFQGDGINIMIFFM